MTSYHHGVRESCNVIMVFAFPKGLVFPGAVKQLINYVKLKQTPEKNNSEVTSFGRCFCIIR